MGGIGACDALVCEGHWCVRGTGAYGALVTGAYVVEGVGGGSKRLPSLFGRLPVPQVAWRTWCGATYGIRNSSNQAK
jgi:hypothetical protein